MIHELLGNGKDSAITGKQIAQAMGIDIRDVVLIIEKERREGKPICASSSRDKSGYYMADSKTELDEYIGKLYRRGSELFKTRRVLQDVSKKMQPDQKPQQAQ